VNNSTKTSVNKLWISLYMIKKSDI